MSETSQSDAVRARETQTGLDENVAAAVSYVLGWVTGVGMYVIEADNETVRFHAAQSVVVFGAIFVASVLVGMLQAFVAVFDAGTLSGLFVGLLSMLLGLVSLVLWIGGIVLWAYLLVRTYQGADPRLPIAAGFAQRLV